MHATGFRQNDEGVELLFENGQTVSVDYLIACDGVASAIRQQMIGDQKRYLGLTTILLDSPHLLKHPLLEGGYFLTLRDNGASFFCYRQRQMGFIYLIRFTPRLRVTSPASQQ